MKPKYYDVLNIQIEFDVNFVASDVSDCRVYVLNTRNAIHDPMRVTDEIYIDNVDDIIRDDDNQLLCEAKLRFDTVIVAYTNYDMLNATISDVNDVSVHINKCENKYTHFGDADLYNLVVNDLIKYMYENIEYADNVIRFTYGDPMSARQSLYVYKKMISLEAQSYSNDVSMTCVE